jgi:hypothetical protein
MVDVAMVLHQKAIRSGADGGSLLGDRQFVLEGLAGRQVQAGRR